MNLIFMRHGEATDNVKGLISDKEIYCFVLPDEGIKTVMESVDILPDNIGDYFIRFGEYGDNKFDIENRLTKFLLDVYNNNDKDNTVLIVSHGSINSYMKRILNVKSSHLKKGKIDVFYDVDFNNLVKHNEVLINICKLDLYKN